MTADAITAKRIDRRDAMKAAIGGAAAAAALSAPGIEGFSFVPDFAAAASQCPAGTTVAGSPASLSRTRTTCGATGCWGYFPSCTLGFGTCTAFAMGSITVNSAANQYSDPQFAFTASGQVRNNNGTMSVVVTNLNANLPFSSCTIGITGNCGSDTFSVTNTGGGITGANTVVTANGTYSGRVRCSGLGTGSATVTVTASCVCSNV